MKRALNILLVSFGLFCSCEKNNVLPDAVAFSNIPNSDIAETQLGATEYTYADLIATTAGLYYEMDAIYDCYRKEGKTYYIMNRREEDSDNANLLVGIEGFLGSVIQIHDGYYVWTGGKDNDTHLYNYDFDEASQVLEGVCTFQTYVDVPNTLVYLSKDCFILQMDVAWRSLSKEKGATFSRVVYKKCPAPETSKVTDSINRNI